MRTRLFFVLSLLAAIFQVGASARDGNVACPSGLSAVACENLQPGDPASEWDVQGSGDLSIQGFATPFSVDQGELVRFKIKTPATNYRLDIYRLGFYGGMGARKIATVVPSATLPQTQPACVTTVATGLVDCGNWSESASWPVPADATSGIYLARLVRADTGGASHIVFIVRDDDGRSDLLFQTSDTTWQAYNSYGGNSLYTGAPAGRAYKVSYNRPFNNRDNTGGPMESWVFATEYPMVRWLEANGYDVSYTSGADTERRGAELLEHKAFLSVGHDEYWSGPQRGAVEAARDAGVHLAFFSGNEAFWKTRWEGDAAGEPFRTLVCYKETKDGAKIDPSPAWTGTWRDPRFSPPADGGRPENALTGTLFMVNGTRHDAITVPAAEGRMRFWRNTTIASLPAGQVATLPTGTLGYEWDEDKDNGFRPAGLMHLSATTVSVSNQYLLDFGNTYGVGSPTHHLTLYRDASGALVFGAGTVQWSWGLDATHDRAGTPADARMQQATVNLFADMSVQPGALQPGLVAASPSSDTAGPSVSIASPANGSSVQSGAAVTIAGTATDSGGAVANVEVSVDGGATWHPASGRDSWTYAWTPYSPGSTITSATIVARAADDSGNLSGLTSISVNVNPGPGLVAAYGFEEAGGTLLRDLTSNGNNGTIAGATWTAAGRYGGGLSFDGVNDLVTINDSATLDLTTAMTIEAWVLPAAQSTWRTALLKETANGLVYGLYAHNNVPRPAGYIRVAGTDVSAAGAAALPSNAWSHLAVTYDGVTLRMFVNGTQVNTVTVGGAITTSTGALRLGGNTIWGEYFQGSLDDVRIYARVLAASEIQADMATSVGGTPLPDTTPPAVSIGSPAPGAVIGGSVMLTAAASDNVAVAGVQFLVDGAAVGSEDVSAPYATSWDSRTVADGNHVVAARARDTAGNVATSAGVTISVTNTPDLTPPSVSITAPAAGTTVSDTTTVTANAADNVAVAGVQVLLDGAALGAEDVSAPYSASWPTRATPNGTHTLTARARDAAGNVTTSAPVTVTVANASGLVAAYAFSEGAGATVADLSGNGRTGTISGAQWTAVSGGKYGPALSFNGSSDWVTIPDASVLDLTTGMTLEAWVRPAALTGWRQVILKEGTNALSYGLYAHNNAPQAAATINVSGTDRTASSPSGLALNTWTHLATTYDGATLRLFINGEQVQSVAAAGSITVSNGPLRLGGNAVWGEYYSGLIDEVRVYNRALTDAEIQNDMNTALSAMPSGDTTPPAVAITAPIGGSTVSGTLRLTADASDAGGIAWVEFRVQNAPIAALDQAAPYETWWNTGAVPNGTTRTITAIARDNAGNMTTSAPVTVTVMNPTDAASVGAWSAPFEIGFVGVNMVQLYTGKILMYPGFENGGIGAVVFDPATGTSKPVPITTSNIFCSGHTLLADGRVLVVGGWDNVNGIIGLQHANIFDPATEQWTRVPDMAYRRWYPTATTLADGRVIVTSGATTCETCLADVPEIYDPVSNTWTQLTAARLAIPYYPLAFLLPDNRLLVTGSTDTATPARALDLATSSWSVVDPTVFDGSSAAMFLPGKVVQSGTASDPSFPLKPAAATTAVLDMTQPSPAWRPTAPMAYPRAYSNMTILPDGSVMTFGGGTDTSGRDLTKSVFAAERWSPATETWTTMASGAVGRLYHSTTLLLPDGRVMVAGGGDISGATDQTVAEYYSPPYLFRGTRPVITAAPAELAYGAPFTVTTGDAGAIASVSLVRAGAATHAFDENQRFIPLTFTAGAGALTVQAPASAAVAPPGHYLLFILNGAGVPSIAKFVRFAAPSSGDTTAPTVSITAPAAGATVSGSISITANAADNVAVAGVQFLLNGAPLGGEDTSFPYSLTWDTRTVGNGPYTISARARDAAGNFTQAANIGVTVSNTAPPPPAGLIAAYAFEEGTGSTTADATGKNHTGTIAGATWNVAGKNGKALSFDGVNDWVTVADANDLDLTAGMTVEAWVKPSALGGWNTVVMKEGTGSTMSYALYANDSDPWPAITARISSGDRSALGTSPLPVGAWTHLAATYDGATLRLYVNGVQVGSRAQTGSITVSSRQLRIGGNAVWGEYFAGLIDDVRIYNRALTAAEIQGDMTTAVR